MRDTISFHAKQQKEQRAVVGQFENLTMRMHMRRFTRITNAFSKKIENHCHAISLTFVYHNFCKIHSSLSITPAMQAGITKKVMSSEDIANLAAIEAPRKRGIYKKRVNTVHSL